MFVLVTFKIDHIPKVTMGLLGLNRKLILAFLLLVENNSTSHQQIEGDERSPKMCHLSYLMPVLLLKIVEKAIMKILLFFDVYVIDYCLHDFQQHNSY
jgi:hypothetical protein